jgi:hypothetical protein
VAYRTSGVRRVLLLGFAVVALTSTTGCKLLRRRHSTPPPPLPASTTTTTFGDLDVKAKPDPIPSPGKGNVKGAVRWDGKPIANVDVRLCEGFSSLGLTSGCTGRTYDAKTDATGAFVIRDVPPKEYGALLVFEPDAPGRYQYQAPKNDFIGAQKHVVRAGTTIDAGITNLFRTDLHVQLPRAAQRTSSTPEIRWAPYAKAVHYELTLSRPYGAGEESLPSINEKVHTASFTPKTPLAPGRWELAVHAHGAFGKLSETADRVLFIVDDEHAQLDPAPAPALQKKPPVPTFERVTPASGTGALQGIILHDDRPTPGIEVKLCETFDPWFSGCGGKIFTTKTNENGVYTFTDLPPKEYKGLTARVFKTADVIYVAAGVMGSKSYVVEPDSTLTPSPTNLFKNDLKVLAPNGKTKTGTFEIKWAPYANAAYYKFTIHRDGTGESPPYTSFRVDEPRFLLDKSLAAGSYRLSVQAFNATGTKLADSKDKSFSVAATK